MRREVWLASAASCVVRKRLETDHGRSYNLSPERNIQPGSRRFSDGTAHFGLFDRRLGDSPDDSRQVLLRGRTSGRSFEALLPMAIQRLNRQRHCCCRCFAGRNVLRPTTDGAANRPAADISNDCECGRFRMVQPGWRWSPRRDLAEPFELDAVGHATSFQQPVPSLCRDAFRLQDTPCATRSSSARLALCLGDLNLFAHLLTTFDNVTVVGKSVVPWPIGDRGSRRSNPVFRQRLAITLQLVARCRRFLSALRPEPNSPCLYISAERKTTMSKKIIAASVALLAVSVGLVAAEKKAEKSTSSRPFARSPASQPLNRRRSSTRATRLLVLPRLRGAVQEGHREVCCQGQPATRGHPPGEAGQVSLYRRQAEPETAVKVGGVKVCFCCNNCQGKVTKASPEEQVQLVFNDEAFAKGFEIKKK